MTPVWASTEVTIMLYHTKYTLQNEFTTEGGKLHDAVKGVMER